MMASMAQQARTMSPVNGTLSPGLGPGLLRQRSLHRAATFGDGFPGLRQRRSSTFSDSAQSLKSSTDSLLLPRAKSADDIVRHEEPSHWHSVPLALALLPAVGGLVFPNGGAVVTDVTLLILAAIFLNWSVRLPWDWYFAAQEIKTQDDEPLPSFTDSSTILEEDSEDTRPSLPSTPIKEGRSPKLSDVDDASTRPSSRSQHSAANELKTHELMALFLCFLGPVVGAWLLHHIRAQLSRPSEGLVSNYNLTIFLLASELRPLSHMIKLVQARTLHLQRLVASNPHQTSPSSSPESLSDLTNRISTLESNFTNGGPQTNPTLQQDLVTSTAKILQAELKPLDRAMRRYEKRATVFTMQTDARIQELESKLADALTLAAAAERSSLQSRQRRGSGVLMMMDWMSWALLLPVQIILAVTALPGKLLSAFGQFFEDIIGVTLGIHKKSRGAARPESKVSRKTVSNGGAGKGGGGGSGAKKTT